MKEYPRQHWFNFHFRSLTPTIIPIIIPIGMGWARVQATSRGGHGDKAHYNRGVLYGAKALTSNRVLPHCEGRRTDVTGPEAVEKVSTTLRACGTTPRRFQCGPLAPLTAGCSVLRRPRNGKNLVPQPTQPWHQDHKKKGGRPVPGQNVERSSQCSSTATPS